MSKIRVLKASCLYPGMVKSFYRDRPDLSHESYGIQYESIMSSYYSWSDCWKRHLEQTGDFEVFEVILNAKPFQQAWARENGCCFSKDPGWIQEVASFQVRTFMPDILFVQDLVYLNSNWWIRLKNEIRGLKVLSYDGINLNDPARFKGCDGVLSCLDDSVEFYRRAGFKNSHLFKLGIDSRILNKIIPGRNTYPLSFVGQINHNRNGHRRRRETIASLSKRIPIDLWITIPSPYRVIRANLHHLIKRGESSFFIKELREQLPLALDGWINIQGRRHRPVYGLDMYQVLADSKITLNVHIDAAGNKAANMRMFEATGMGTCLVTDWKENIGDYFEKDREIVTFENIDECLEKIKYLMEHEGEREQIARSGQARTLKEHNIMKSIDNIVPVLYRMVGR